MGAAHGAVPGHPLRLPRVRRQRAVRPGGAVHARRRPDHAAGSPGHRQRGPGRAVLRWPGDPAGRAERASPGTGPGTGRRGPGRRPLGRGVRGRAGGGGPPGRGGRDPGRPGRLAGPSAVRGGPVPAGPGRPAGRHGGQLPGPALARPGPAPGRWAAADRAAGEAGCARPGRARRAGCARFHRNVRAARRAHPGRQDGPGPGCRAHGQYGTAGHLHRAAHPLPGRAAASCLIRPAARTVRWHTWNPRQGATP